MGQILTLVLDVAVLIGLGVTIFYCFRLSKSMNNFRQHRQDMNRLIENLSKNIDEALRAIDGLKIAGDRSGRDLQKIINESRAMADELQMINETSNNLANRLEKVAQGGSAAAQATEDKAKFTADVPSQPSRKPVVTDKPAFFIHDRDFTDEAPASNDIEEEDMPEQLQSQAEKELMAALRKNKKPSSRGVF
jgi:hypothetical protein